ncbi:hypothetical protein Tco_0542944 [Tanacetum coccineum]
MHYYLLIMCVAKEKKKRKEKKRKGGGGVARVGPLSGKDPLVIVVADTDRLPHVCCGSALSACVLKHPGRSQLISRLNGSSLRFRDSSASSTAICFFRGYLLLRDVSLYRLDIKSVLTQKGLDIFCHKFYIPGDVHPQLRSPNQTIHKMPVGKIGVYTRFFEYANFQLPLSTFLFNVDSFVCPASFPWHIGKNVSRDPFPMSREFNADDYAVLVAHPAPFRKFPEPFLCLIGMSHYYTLDKDTYLSFLHDDGTEMDLSAFIHVVDPTKVKVVERERAEEEKKLLESTASVDKFFNEGGSADHGDSAVGGGHDAEIELVTGAENIAVENVGISKLQSESCTGAKSRLSSRGLCECSILNVEVGVDAVATLPLVTSLVSTTPGSGVGNPMIYLRAFISVPSIVLPPVMTEAVVTSHAASDPPIPVLEIVDLLKARDDEVENLKAQLLLKEAESAEATLGLAASLPGMRKRARDDEVENLKAQLLLKEAEAAEAARLRAQDLELKDLNVVMSSLKSQDEGLVDQVHALETTCSSLRDQVSGYERLKEQIEEFQDSQMNIVNDMVAKLDADLLEMALHLEKKFYPHLLTTISGRRWLLTHGVKLAIVKCLNSPEYLTALGSAISRAIEKGMQNGLSVGIDHEKAGRSLANVVAYNPAAEADYNSALQRLREVDFPLLAELSSHKDASDADIMDLLRLESPIADSPRMRNLQPDIRENVAAQGSALIGIWVPLVDPLSAKNLIGAASTFGNVLADVVTTTALSTTFASASSVPPITRDDYEIVSVDGQEDAQGNVQGNVASFHTVEFEKEELDTTTEREPPS